MGLLAESPVIDRCRRRAGIVPESLDEPPLPPAYKRYLEAFDRYLLASAPLEKLKARRDMHERLSAIRSSGDGWV